MTIVDLSHPIDAQCPVYPGTLSPEIHPANNLAEDGFAELRISMNSHTATHVDAPCHLLEGGLSLDEFPADYFIGQAVLLDLTRSTSPQITVADLEKDADRLINTDFLLLRTGWSRYWGEPVYFERYPYLTEPAAEWLSRFPLRGVGIDTISVDPLHRADLPAHRHLLGQQILIIENLTNLDAIQSVSPLFSCLPLPISRADGAPVRAVVIEERCAPTETKPGEANHD